MHLSRLRKFALLVAGLACLPAPAGALITVGSLDLSNPGTAIVVEDGLAYVGIYGVLGFGIGGLVIADVSDPSAPVEIGAIEYASYSRSITIRDLVVEGGFAYLAIEKTPVYPADPRTGSLWIVDVSDPTAPVEIGAFEVPLATRGIAVVDNLAYLTVLAYLPFPVPFPPPEIEPSGMRVIDVANPSAPVQVGSIELSGSPNDIEVVGDLAYIADYLAGLRTIDVSDPTAPVGIDLAASYGRPFSLTVVDGLAYLANPGSHGRGGLSVFDLSDPRAPIEIGVLQLPYGASDVAVEGGLAYVAAADLGLQAIDVSNPEAPVALGRLATPYRDAATLAVADGFAYVLTPSTRYSRNGALQIIDLSIPTTPIEVGTTTVSGIAFSPEVAVVGDLAYVTVGEEGLRIIDVSNPATPVEIGALDTPGFASGVTGVNDVAYVADGGTGLRIIDVTEPTAPVEISAIDTPGFAGTVEVVNGLAYVADGDSGLRVIDVSNAEAPVEVGAIETPGHARNVAVVGGLAYVADVSGGLRIIDVSKPEQPVEIGALDSPGQSQGIAVSGGRAYLADRRGGLRIIDVSNPEQPVELGAFTPSYEVYAVAVVGEIAYLGAYEVRAVDVSDPTAPLEVGALHTSSLVWGEVFDLVVAEGLVYAVIWEPRGYPHPPGTRLMIVDFGPEYAPKISVEIDIKPGSDAGSINPASRGVIPVAILGSESFDVTDIDLTTLAFGPDGATPAHSRGGHPKDVNGDGAMDLVSHFWVQDTGITSETDPPCVSGKTLDDAAFEGCGAIQSRP
jgi:hypothetical protein